MDVAVNIAPGRGAASVRYKAKADVNAVDSAKDTALTLAIRSRTQQGTDAAGGWTERREGEARAAALVRSGASWQGVPGISSAEKSRYKTLRKEWCVVISIALSRPSSLVFIMNAVWWALSGWSRAWDPIGISVKC